MSSTSLQKQENEIPTQSEASTVLQIIERAAQNPDVDVDKMERLLSMHERITGKNAEQAFNAAMMSAQQKLPAIFKDAENSHTSSRYSTLERIIETIEPIISEHGFSLSFGTAESHMPCHYRVTCTVSHIGGHSRVHHVDIPVDDAGPGGKKNKTQTHAFGSSMTYGRRYLTLLIFNIATKDDDGNGADTECITEEQKEEIIQLIKETDTDTAAFLGFYKVGSVDDLPVKSYASAKAILIKKKEPK